MVILKLKIKLQVNGDNSVKNKTQESQAVLTDYFMIEEVSSIETCTENSEDMSILSNE